MNKHQYYNTSTTIPVLQYQYSYFDSFLQSHLILISRLFRPNSKVKGIQTCHLPPLRHTTSYGVALYLYTWYCNPSGILLQEDLTHLQLQLLLSLDVRLNICQMFLGSETEKKHKMIKALKHSVFISHGNRTGRSRYCSTLYCSTQEVLLCYSERPYWRTHIRVCLLSLATTTQTTSFL